MADLVQRMRADLTAAMRARDTETVRVLRTTLAAVANAEAQPAEDGGPTSLQISGGIAGASSGLGAAEVARRELTDDDVRALVATERAELREAGQPAAAVLDAYL